MSSLVVNIKGRASLSRTFADAAVNTSTEAITIADHGLVDGDVVRFTNSGGALPTGLTSRKHYYVVSAGASSFKVSETSGGSAVNITAAAGGGTHTVRKVSTPYDRRLMRAAKDAKEMAILMSNLFESMAIGTESATVEMQTDPEDQVAASGTFTLASVAADDAVTIGGVTLTAKASPSGEAQWSQAGSDSADATALANCINAHSVLSKVVSAVAESAVVTVTCKVKGFVGNLITISETGSTITASGTALTGGTGGAVSTATTFSFV